MDSLLFAVNAVAPLILLVALGYFLRRIGLFKKDFASWVNKLVFTVFLPVMLFLNIYEIDVSDGISFGYILYAVSVLLIVFSAALLLMPLITKERRRKAPLIQACFRSNYALIGVALASAISPENGAGVASVLVLFTIPIFNILAVILFAVYSDGERPTLTKTLLDILKNPLIVGVAAGALLLLLKNLLSGAGVGTELSDIPAVYKTLKYLSSVATPLALLALGAQFEFSAVGKMKRELIFGVLMRALAVSFLGVFVAYFMGVFTPAEIACFIGVFATPVAVSTVPMTQELGGDTELAGQLVVWTTLASAFSIFTLTFAMRALGVF